MFSSTKVHIFSRQHDALARRLLPPESERNDAPCFPQKHTSRPRSPRVVERGPAPAGLPAPVEAPQRLLLRRQHHPVLLQQRQLHHQADRSRAASHVKPLARRWGARPSAPATQRSAATPAPNISSSSSGPAPASPGRGAPAASTASTGAFLPCARRTGLPSALNTTPRGTGAGMTGPGRPWGSDHRPDAGPRPRPRWPTAACAPPCPARRATSPATRLDPPFELVVARGAAAPPPSRRPPATPAPGPGAPAASAARSWRSPSPSAWSISSTRAAPL